jgi:hypothetical protein
MPWIIDKDLTADPNRPEGTNANAKGLLGPGTYSGDGSELKHQFRMSDDDGMIYYIGRNDTADDNNAFGPLDDFGAPNAGCTTIEYFDEDTRQWRIL